MTAPFLSDLALVGGLLLPVAVIVGIVFKRGIVETTIQNFFWQRTVSIQRYVWREKSSYIGYPKDSRNHQSTVEVRQSYQPISQRTTTTIINGQPVVSTQPVYAFVPHRQKKFLYEAQEWVKSREIVASGKDQQQAYWPEYTLADDERVDERQETYQVVFQAMKLKGKIYRITLPKEEDWLALDEHATYTLRVSLFGTVLKVQKAGDPLLRYDMK